MNEAQQKIIARRRTVKAQLAVAENIGNEFSAGQARRELQRLDAAYEAAER